MLERDRTRMLAVASGALLLSVLVWFNYSAVLPLIVDDWGLSGLRAGVIFAAFQAGYLLAIVPMGALADRHSPRFVIAAGATATGLASLAFALAASGFATGTALRLLAGIGMAGVYVPGMRFLSDWFDESVRGRALGVYAGTFAAGSGLSFLVASRVAASVDWRAAVAVTSLGALAAGPLILLAGRDAPDAAARERRWLDPALLRNRSYLSAVGVYAFHNWELFGAWNWTVAFLLAAPALAGDPAAAGTIAGAMMALGGAGNALGGWLSDRLGRERVIGAALATSTVISAVIGGLGWLSLPALVAVVAVYGVVLVADSAPVSTAVTEVVADENVGTALSIQSLLGFATTAVSPVVFGAALDAGGFGLAFPTLAAGGLVGLASLALHARRRRGSTPAGPGGAG